MRDFRDSDRPAILSLISRFSEFELPAWRDKREVDAANLHTVSGALDTLADGDAVFVAETDGVFAGFIHLQTRTDHFTGRAVGYVSDLAVHPDHERQGVAGQLLDRAYAWAKDRGFGEITLHVFEGNNRAKTFYENRGFARDIVQYTQPIE